MPQKRPNYPRYSKLSRNSGRESVRTYALRGERAAARADALGLALSKIGAGR